MVSRIRLDLLQQVLVEHLGVAGRFEDVVFEDVPSGEDHILKLCQWDEVVNLRGPRLGTLAEANGAHLGNGADWFCNALADGLNAGDQCGGNCAETDNHDSQFSSSWLDL